MAFLTCHLLSCCDITVAKVEKRQQSKPFSHPDPRKVDAWEYVCFRLFHDGYIQLWLVSNISATKYVVVKTQKTGCWKD
jgi:hypothetical protein